MTQEISDLLELCLEQKEFKTAYKVLQQSKPTYNRHSEYMERLAEELITYYLTHELEKPYKQQNKSSGFGQM